MIRRRGWWEEPRSHSCFLDSTWWAESSGRSAAGRAQKRCSSTVFSDSLIQAGEAEGLPESRCRTCRWFGSGWGCWSGRWGVSPEAAESEQADPAGGPTENFPSITLTLFFPSKCSSWQSGHVTATTSLWCQFTHFYHHFLSKCDPTNRCCNLSTCLIQGLTGRGTWVIVCVCVLLF